MKRFLILAFLVGLQLSAFGQVDTLFSSYSSGINANTPFVYFTNGTILHTRDIIYTSESFGRKVFYVNDIKYDAKQVKFYRSSEGFFAGSGKYFAQRTERKGNINIYKHSYTLDYNQPNGGTIQGRDTSYTYNVGFGPLKKLNYNDLSQDLIDCPNSMAYLNKHKNRRNIRRGLLITGVALVAVGFRLDNDLGDNMIMAGVTSVAVGGVLSLYKRKYLVKALNAYDVVTF